MTIDFVAEKFKNVFFLNNNAVNSQSEFIINWLRSLKLTTHTVIIWFIIVHYLLLMLQWFFENWQQITPATFTVRMKLASDTILTTKLDRWTAALNRFLFSLSFSFSRFGRRVSVRWCNEEMKKKQHPELVLTQSNVGTHTHVDIYGCMRMYDAAPWWSFYWIHKSYESINLFFSICSM